MKKCINFFIHIRLFVLYKLLLILSVPTIFITSCKNTSKCASQGSLSGQNDSTIIANDSIVKEPISVKPDTVKPVYYDPVITCDYGVIYIDSLEPIYTEPYPVTEYGVVHPESE